MVEDDPIPVTVDTPTRTCLGQIDVYVNHTLAATYFAPDPGAFDVPMPEGIDAGMAVLLEVVVTDCSGNQTTTSDWLDIEVTATGVVAGEVYDDTTGRPLEGADVTFIGTRRLSPFLNNRCSWTVQLCRQGRDWTSYDHHGRLQHRGTHRSDSV